MDVVNNQANHRFELQADGGMALLVYEVRDDRLVLIHTEVPKAYEGRGYGGQLVRAAMEYAQDQRLSVVPVCPFARTYLRRHPELASGRVSDVPDTLDS